MEPYSIPQELTNDAIIVRLGTIVIVIRVSAISDSAPQVVDHIHTEIKLLLI